MPSFTQLVRSSIICLALVKSSMAVYTFNTSYNDPMNGHFGNPAEEIKNMGANQACLDAYVAEIDCDPILFNFSYTPNEKLYTKTNFDKACQKTCEVSLAGWLVKTWPICGSNSQPEAVRSLFTGVGDENVNMLHYYWSYCTQDLKNGTYCLTEDFTYLDVNSTYTQEEKDAACADTCFTQNSASLWNTYSAIGNGETSTINIANVKDVCPNVDTSNYEVLKPLTAIAAEGSTPSTSGSSSASATSSMSSGTASAAQTLTSSKTSGTSTPSGTSPVISETSKPNTASTLVTSALMALPLLFAALL